MTFYIIIDALTELIIKYMTFCSVVILLAKIIICVLPKKMTYENQFDNEPIEQIPDVNKEYYLNRDEYSGSTGFTYLFKLLWLIDKYPELINWVSLDKKDINVKVKGWTALHFVCHNYKSGKLPKVIQLLSDLGVDMNARTYTGYTALHFVSDWPIESNKLPQVLQSMIRGGVDVNDKGGINISALHLICRYYKSNNLPDAVKILINAGANVNALNYCGSTALHEICNNQEFDSLPEVIQILVDAGIDVNIINDYYSTGLYYAICCRKKSVYPIQILIKVGVDLNVDQIIICNNSEIYNSIIMYRKHKYSQIKPFLKYLNEEQIKLLSCFSQFKSYIKSVKELYNQIYYCPNNIGALLCESTFENSFRKTHYSNKIYFLFNSKN